MVDDNGTPDSATTTWCTRAGEPTAARPIRRAASCRSRRASARTASCSRSARSDYGPALDAIIAIIAKQLGAVCLPRPLVRNAGRPGRLQRGVGAAAARLRPRLARRPLCARPASSSCSPPEQGGADHDRARRRDLPRRAARGQADAVTRRQAAVPTATDGDEFNDGWFYDDFSDEVQEELPGQPKPARGVHHHGQAADRRHRQAGVPERDPEPGQQPHRPGPDIEHHHRLGLRQRHAQRPHARRETACDVGCPRPASKWADGIDHSMFCHPEDSTSACSAATPTPTARRPGCATTSDRRRWPAPRDAGHENGSRSASTRPAATATSSPGRPRGGVIPKSRPGHGLALRISAEDSRAELQGGKAWRRCATIC